METAMIVLYQAVVMFIMIVVGYVCYKIYLISPTTNIQMSNLLLLVVNPCIIFISFQTDFDTRLVTGLLTSIGLSLASIVLMQVLTRFVLKKAPKASTRSNGSDVFTQTAVFSQRRWFSSCLAAKAFCISRPTSP